MDFKKEKLSLPAEDFEDNDSSIKIDEKALVIRKISVAKRTLIAFFLIIAGLLIFYYRDYINLYGIRRVINFFENITNNEIKVSTDDITYEITENNQYGFYKQNIVILSNDKLSLYSKDGEELLNSDLKYAMPALQCTDKYIMVFDRQGTNLKVFNSYMKLFDKTYDGEIITAKMNNNGYFAVAVKEKNYKGVVIVYNSKFEELYRRYSADNFISDVDISNDNKMLAVSLFNSVGGRVLSKIEFFNFNNTDVLSSIEGIEDLIFSIDFKRNRSLHFLTKEALYVSEDYTTAEKAESFENEYLQKFLIEDDEHDILALSMQKNANNSELIIFDFSGKAIVKNNLKKDVKSIDINHGKIGVLTNDNIMIYSTLGALKSEVDAPVDSKKIEITDKGEILLFRLDRATLLK